MRDKKIKAVLALFTTLLLFGHYVAAQQITVAVAANMQNTAKILAIGFKKKSGISVDIISGASGKLVTQMSNGAPYDVFLSADMRYADELYKKGVATTQPKVYAQGTLIICTTMHPLVVINDWQKLVQHPDVKKIAIANPKVAPYGQAAIQALTKTGILKKIKHKLVYAESISQVNTYIRSGVVDLGFTVQSFLYDGTAKHLIRAVIPSTYSPPVKQGMVLLKRAQNNTAAKKFMSYVLSTDGQAILKRYGYLPPN